MNFFFFFEGGRGMVNKTAHKPQFLKGKLSWRANEPVSSFLPAKFAHILGVSTAQDTLTWNNSFHFVSCSPQPVQRLCYLSFFCSQSNICAAHLSSVTVILSAKVLMLFQKLMSFWHLIILALIASSSLYVNDNYIPGCCREFEVQ